MKQVNDLLDGFTPSLTSLIPTLNTKSSGFGNLFDSGTTHSTSSSTMTIYDTDITPISSEYRINTIRPKLCIFQLLRTITLIDHNLSSSLTPEQNNAIIGLSDYMNNLKNAIVSKLNGGTNPPPQQLTQGGKRLMNEQGSGSKPGLLYPLLQYISLLKRLAGVLHNTQTLIKYQYSVDSRTFGEFETDQLLVECLINMWILVTETRKRVSLVDSSKFKASKQEITFCIGVIKEMMILLINFDFKESEGGEGSSSTHEIDENHDIYGSSSSGNQVLKQLSTNEKLVYEESPSSMSRESIKNEEQYLRDSLTSSKSGITKDSDDNTLNLPSLRKLQRIANAKKSSSMMIMKLFKGYHGLDSRRQILYAEKYILNFHFVLVKLGMGISLKDITYGITQIAVNSIDDIDPNVLVTNNQYIEEVASISKSVSRRYTKAIKSLTLSHETERFVFYYCTMREKYWFILSYYIIILYYYALFNNGRDASHLQIAYHTCIYVKKEVDILKALYTDTRERYSSTILTSTDYLIVEIADLTRKITDTINIISISTSKTEVGSVLKSKKYTDDDEDILPNTKQELDSQSNDFIENQLYDLHERRKVNHEAQNNEINKAISIFF